MRNIISIFTLSLWLITGISNAQDITNTLAPNGNFKVKDGSADYLSLSQLTGFLSLSRGLILPNTTSPSLGVIYKGADRFIHNYGTNNTFIGLNSGNLTMTGSDNSALGFQSLSSNTTGSRNTGNGYQTLYSNTTGYYNTANGYQALHLNTEGYNNTANGLFALYSNTSGLGNTANGVQSLYFNTTGNNNTANGVLSLFQNTTGFENTANGYQALYSNTISYYNTAIGSGALYLNTIGYRNTALGSGSGASIINGSNLTCIGFNSQPTTPDAVNQITLGDNLVTSLRCNVQTITSLSDARDKKNITDLSLGLDFISKLKPRQFNWDKREWYDDNKSDGSKMKEEPTAGFIAQELDEAQTTENAEWLNLVLKDNPEKWEATPGNLFPVLVKAVQELAIKNEQLKIKNENLEERLTKF